jgi:hypothetical protein
MDSLNGLRKAFCTSQTIPVPTCLPLLDVLILKMKALNSLLALYLQEARALFAHTLISVESFLASLSLLEGLYDCTNDCLSILALFCDIILRRDPYWDKYDIEIAGKIMEHIDTHYASISRGVNTELGCTYIRDPLLEISDN